MAGRYVIGDKYPPFWVKKRIMPFRRLDGSIGFEFHGKGGILILDKGDMLLRGDGEENITVRKKR